MLFYNICFVTAEKNISLIYLVKFKIIKWKK